METGTNSWNRLLIDGAHDLGIHLDNETAKKFSLYANELIAWNRKINLTAITDPFEIAVKHFLDSIAPSLHIAPDASIIDIGSGGGFPGIPLAILLPKLSITLIDTSRKKVSFLKHLARFLQLTHVSVYQISAEDISKNQQFSRTYNIIISRALFPLDKLISLGLPLLTENGEIVAMKGKKVSNDKEMTRISELLNKWKNEGAGRSYSCSIKKYKLPVTGDERSLVHFQFAS